MKYAVYVEGLSELLFVADVLHKYLGYDPERCGILCINCSADNFKQMSHPPMQGDENSENYYQIVNVNNDNLVISKLKSHIPRLISKGFNVLIGLKDVYGEAYKQILVGEPRVDRSFIEDMHKAQFGAIGAPEGIDCRLHFAIMEYETWMLALIERYVTSQGKDLAAISGQLCIDMAQDFEQTVYHPYNLVKKIYQACGKDYSKHSGELLSFFSTLTKEDYEGLRRSGRCASFAKFLDSLLGDGMPVLP